MVGGGHPGSGSGWRWWERIGGHEKLCGRGWMTVTLSQEHVKDIVKVTLADLGL